MSTMDIAISPRPSESPVLGGLDRLISGQAGRSAVLGVFWVAVNLLLGWLGLRNPHGQMYFVLVGALDGFVVALLVIMLAGERFQIGISSLFVGIGLENIGGESGRATTIVQGIAETVHKVVDAFCKEFAAFKDGLPGNAGLEQIEQFHEQYVESVFALAVWIALFIIVASLILNCVLSGGRKGRTGAGLRPAARSSARGAAREWISAPAERS